MGIEQFAVEWHERRNEVFALYEVLTEDCPKFYPIVAESPYLIMNYCGNVVPEVMGLQRFEQYILPHYDEFTEMMHAHGELLSVHFDANTKLLAPAIAKSKIDCIEAFAPFPDSEK